MEGFTHLIPFAAGHEVIRQQRRGLTLVRMTPDVIYDQLIGAGCARSWCSRGAAIPGVGSLHRLRDAVEHGWPRPLAIEEYSHGAMANAYDAGAANLPFAALRDASRRPRRREPALPDGDLSVHRRDARRRCRRCGRTSRSFTRRKPTARATSSSTGIIGVQKEAVLAARRVVVTVEEVVDTLRRRGIANACILPRWTVERDRRRARRRISVVRLRLLRARQRVLSQLGRDLARPATASRPGSTST